MFTKTQLYPHLLKAEGRVLLSRCKYNIQTTIKYKQDIINSVLTIFLRVLAAVKILWTRQVLLNMAPNDKENPTDRTAVLAF